METFCRVAARNHARAGAVSCSRKRPDRSTTGQLTWPIVRGATRRAPTTRAVATAAKPSPRARRPSRRGRWRSYAPMRPAGPTAPGRASSRRGRSWPGCRSLVQRRSRFGSRVATSTLTTWRICRAADAFPPGIVTPNTPPISPRPAAESSRRTTRAPPRHRRSVRRNRRSREQQPHQPAVGRCAMGARRHPTDAWQVVHRRTTAVGQQQIERGGDLEREWIALDHLQLGDRAVDEGCVVGG